MVRYAYANGLFRYNWALLQDEIASFAERCETEVKTAEDAERLYNEVFAAAQAVETTLRRKPR